MQRWTFHDPVTNTTYTLPVNPKEGGEREYEKTVNTQDTTAPDGRTIVFEGRDKPGAIAWSSYFRSTAERDDFITWWRKRRQILRTNDLGEQDWIYLVKLSPKRKHVVNRRYRADYDINAIVLDIPT